MGGRGRLEVATEFTGVRESSIVDDGERTATKMNQLEAQVNDLRSFLAVPSLAAQESEYSPGPHHPSSQHPSHLSALGDNSAPQHPQSPLQPGGHLGSQKGSKRKADDDESSTSKQQRSKRNRVSLSSPLYVSAGLSLCSARNYAVIGFAGFIFALTWESTVYLHSLVRPGLRCGAFA